MSDWKNKYSDNYKYQTYCTKIKERIDEIPLMIFSGFTFSQIAKELGVPNSLLWSIRCDKKYTDVHNAFKTEMLQLENVENALYRLCVGYSVEEEQAIKVKKEYYNKKGKKCCEEHVEIVQVMKHVEPKFDAVRFYLLNNSKGKYHTENRNDEDSRMNDLLMNAKDVIVSIKKTADEEISDGDAD